MRIAALVLGITGGVVGMLVGFFGYAFAEVWSWLFGAIEQVESETGFRADLDEPPADPTVTRLISVSSPILALAGGGMATTQAGAGGALMLFSAAGMLHAFGFGAFTMFPIGMCAAGGVLALIAAMASRPGGIG